ncbi:hypothetical protein BDD43_2060 [Mucilaginibacter gracilis]|uniref:Uncharacterized protein n=1 Tax=Mucilaginibacter gracilis TaxID=423350 RepID=A0A495J1D5_9SPHI|nr:hypothetical protein [Mucilaginibacter gracilis]RKR81899.1 hypothetical protein BDD43_2060 [Mucilaginibacter gracilis]
MTDLITLINKNQPDFETWEHQLGEHLQLLYEPGTVDEDDRVRIFYQTNELLIGIAKNFFTYGKFKDEWDNSKCSMFPFGQYLLLRSKKMDIAFHWGVEWNHFYLEAPVLYSENIRFMTDDFWTALLELKSLGEFEFTGGGRLNAKEKPYVENKTSTVFQMIRSFMLFQVDQMSGDYPHYTSLDLGSLIIKWPMSKDWPALLEHACKAFRLMYNLNYQLWKISDLAAKKLK